MPIPSPSSDVGISHSIARTHVPEGFETGRWRGKASTSWSRSLGLVGRWEVGDGMVELGSIDAEVGQEGMPEGFKAQRLI